MKKTISLVTVMIMFCTALILGGCGPSQKYELPNPYTKKAYTGDGVPAYEGKSPASGLDKSGRYLEVDGVPMLMLGGQLRTDFFMQLEGKTADELNEYFALARRMNITVVQVPICWSDIEKTEGTYDFSVVEKYISFAERNDLKLELLWFGSYMCGVSVLGGYVPEYIHADLTTYPALNSYLYDGWLGLTYLLYPGSEHLLARETAAMRFMMEKLYDYDRMHGGRHTVVGIQIENEPDMLVTDQSQYFADGTDIDDVKRDMVKHLDEMGKAVKGSDYRCYTRVNLTARGTGFYNSIIETDGIDFVGLDPYNDRLNNIGTALDELKALEGNFAHIAENGGEYTNNDQLELLAFTKGCGYEVFEVVTTANPQLVDWELRGVFNTDFTKKPHTQRLIDANKIYRDGFLDLVLAEEGHVLGFNLTTGGGLETTRQTLSAGGIEVTHSTTARGIAYAAVRGNVITIASTKADTFTIGAKALYAEKGTYSLDGVWHSEGSVNVKNGTLTVEPTAVYRILVAENEE